MEATSSPQDTNTHAASLLAYLNHQRDQGIFCDCVLRQRQNSDQLYHAHSTIVYIKLNFTLCSARCILAASSPVLASILSSSGALVELHDPSLSDTVLPSLLDYIYTGVLPNPLSQQDYYRLLSAACHMQMKKLQDALRATWLQIPVNASDDKSAPGIAGRYPCKETENTCKTDLKTFKDLPSSATTYSFQRLETTTTQQLLNEELFQEAQINSVSTDPSIENGDRSITQQYSNSLIRTGSATLEDLNSFSILESIDKVDACDNRQVKSLTQQNSMRHKADRGKVHDISGVIQYRDVDEHHSPNFLKADIEQRIPEEELLSTSENRKRGSSAFSSSSRSCYGAVPVICHSSRAAVLQQSEVSAGLPHNQASESSVQVLSNMAHFPLFLSTDDDNTVEAVTTDCKDQEEVQNQDPRSTSRHTKCATGCKVNKDHNSNNVHHFKFSEHTNLSSSYNMNNNNQNANRDSLQSHTKHLGEYLIQNNDSRRGLKHQIESDLDPVPSKYQRLDCFECQRTLLTTATQEQSKDQGAVVSLPMETQDTGSNFHYEECLEEEVRGEHSYSSRYPAVTDIEENHCKTSGPITDWYPNVYKGDKSRKDDISSKGEYKVSNTQTKFTCITSQSGLVNSLSASKHCTVLESRTSSRPETIEPHCSSKAPIDNNLSGTTRHTGPPYHWQSKPCEIASLYDFNHKLSKPGLSPNSDELSDVDSFDFSGQRSLRQYFPVETEDHSDINTKHNETAAITSHNNAQTDQGSSIARGGSIDESDRERDSKEEKPFDIKQYRTRVWVTQNTGVMEGSKPNEGETIISTIPVCSPLSEPEYDRASKPPTVSVCIPCTLPASMATDKSAHLSSSNHQAFQCSLCDRSFSQKGSLNRHVRSHLGVRPFPCPCCRMTFSRQYRVTEHMRVHQRCALGNGLQKTPESSVANNEERPPN
ncbi:hypothetical protein XENORESO_006279 [Xenotaenia resolanae]|uniref:Uncharacterized protein n=1 Tax=Xenotaenia resolanae TaxID=208358 RepID=A0ABV0VV42_9TELE